MDIISRMSIVCFCACSGAVSRLSVDSLMAAMSINRSLLLLQHHVRIKQVRRKPLVVFHLAQKPLTRHIAVVVTSDHEGRRQSLNSVVIVILLSILVQIFEGFVAPLEFA